MPDKTPLEMALEREAKGEIDTCGECEYVRIVGHGAYCGISGKLLHPMMFERGQGSGPALRCRKRKEAMNMGLTGADLARLGPEARRQVMEKLGMVGTGKPAANKYHNQPDKRGDITFDSRKEARRYDELMVLLQAGKIRGLKLQPQFTLQESYITPEGVRFRAIRYVADFSYERPTAPDAQGQIYWLPVVEDVKSKATRTRTYLNNRKQFRAKYGYDITEV